MTHLIKLKLYLKHGAPRMRIETKTKSAYNNAEKL